MSAGHREDARVLWQRTNTLGDAKGFAPQFDGRRLADVDRDVVAHERLRDDVESFDPLVDAVPETFVGNDITVYAREPTTVELRGETFRLPEGVCSVPEYAGVFAMARGYATKAGE